MIVWRFKKGSSLINPATGPSVDSSSAIKLDFWEDAAGFSFSYPEDISIDPHEEDEENYAHLELTLPGYEGRIVILVHWRRTRRPFHSCQSGKRREN